MTAPVLIQFVGMDPEPAIEACLRDCAGSLTRHDLLHCHVYVERRQRSRRAGGRHVVCVEVVFSGGGFVVNLQQDDDIHIAMRDAFGAVDHQLCGRSQRLDVH